MSAPGLDGDWFGGRAPALLVLADGEVFEGEAIGASPPDGVATGELVFNNVALRLNAVLAGFGLAYLPEDQVQTYVANGRLIRVLAERGFSAALDVDFEAVFSRIE